ncbi:MAG TPA: ParB/RepB/Spo0J family partition protein [Polyangiaceae bacterium]|nr:ParB/RepB/Spo0J family partition protein [Polyangiaceae bacterium]
MSDIIKIPLDRILPNPKQVRKTFQRIEELARSIAQYGLIHNLVVVPRTEPGYYELVAGERRYRALTLLAKDGRLPSLEVNCLVISGEGEFENVVENLAREDVPLWEVGRTYLGFYESGFTQAEIAARIGKSQGHVSTAMILARSLAPAVVVRLSQLAPNAIPIQRLLRISTLVDDEDEPDEEAQSRLFQQMLASPARRGRRAARPRTQKEALWLRFQRLRQGKVGNRVDPVYQTFLDSLVKYLAGEAKGIAP